MQPALSTATAYSPGPITIILREGRIQSMPLTAPIHSLGPITRFLRRNRIQSAPLAAPIHSSPL